MKEKVKAFTLPYIWPLRLSVQYFALYPDAKRSLTIDKRVKYPNCTSHLLTCSAENSYEANNREFIFYHHYASPRREIEHIIRG